MASTSGFSEIISSAFVNALSTFIHIKECQSR